MTDPLAGAAPLSERTAWARNLGTPLRAFLEAETGSAAILLAATVAALIWANVDAPSYRTLWGTELSIRVGGHGISQDLRHWVNAGLMTLFFFVVGLEARREFDVGELRERRRVAVPLVTAAGGMLLPIAIYLAVNAGRPSEHGWAAAMSTDTAFALGMLTLVAPRAPQRLRAFLLTIAVIDDLVAIAIIAVVYSDRVEVPALLVALGILAAILLVRAARIGRGPVFALLGLGAWGALFESGVDPVVVGVAMGLLTFAYPAARGDLERATDLFRLFREQPTPELARSARTGVVSAISPNDRLQLLFHPWTSHVIVPLFALANAGISVTGGSLSRAVTSPITLGILLGYVVGKPVGITGASWLLAGLSRGRLRPPVGRATVVGGGAIAGIGFTVSLLVATLAFHGAQLEEAKTGVLGAALGASAAAWVVFRATALLPRRLRIRVLAGAADLIVDLAAPVDPRRDHVRGPQDASVTLVEYGDFECTYCGRAEPIVRGLLAGHGDVRFVWRHLPLSDVHPHAQLAAEAVEAADDQGAFWEMHDLLLGHQGDLRAPELIGYAVDLGLDVERFEDHLRRRAGAARIAEDVESADLSGVSGTPTLFINGRRHRGAYDLATLTSAVRTAMPAGIPGTGTS